MSDSITLERAQEIDKYLTSEIIRHDIRVCGDALEALLERFAEYESDFVWLAEDGSDEI